MENIYRFSDIDFEQYIKEDNIIENGKAKVDKWLTLAKKFGTKCKDVS